MTSSKKIFVSIASYRDPETTSTILDAISKAKNKNSVFFGLLYQDSLPINFALSKNENIKILEYDWRESQGTCWARNAIQECLYDGEEYYLQIDSHHRFCHRWDEKLILLIEELKKNYEKPIIGGYCPGYKPGNNELLDSPCRICCHPNFTNQGDLVFYPKTIKNFLLLREKNIPAIPARFLSGHFLFADGIFSNECSYDPNLYFRGEEISLSARAYTSGYDFFHPTEPIIWHQYMRLEQEKHWNNHTSENGFLISATQRSDNAKARVRALLGMESSSIKFGKYGLGSKRQLHEYELYAGVDFKSKRVHKKAYDIKDICELPHIMSEKKWDNGMMTIYKIETEINTDILSKIKNGQPEIISIIAENTNGEPVYRKDIKNPYIQNIQTKIYLESGMDEKPNSISIIKHENKKIIKLLTTQTFKILS